MDATCRFGIRRYEAGATRCIEAHVIAETSVALAVNGKSWLSFSCTPLDIEALAAGFLYNEGVISSREEIGLVEVCRERHLVDIWLTCDVEKPLQWQRTSGCMGGFTSKGSDGEPAITYSIKGDGLIMSPEDITGLLASLSESQGLYPSAGAIRRRLFVLDNRGLFALYLCTLYIAAGGAPRQSIQRKAPMKKGGSAHGSNRGVPKTQL
jgi:formate dehydrogenase accessory protein FdhD